MKSVVELNTSANLHSISGFGNPDGSKNNLQDILENGTLNYGGRELTIEETEKVRDFFNIAIKRMLS